MFVSTSKDIKYKFSASMFRTKTSLSVVSDAFYFVSPLLLELENCLYMLAYKQHKIRNGYSKTFVFDGVYAPTVSLIRLATT